jgi:hypothetical protein
MAHENEKDAHENGKCGNVYARIFTHIYRLKLFSFILYFTNKQPESERAERENFFIKKSSSITL